MPLEDGFTAKIPIYDFNPKQKGVREIVVTHVECGILNKKPVWIVTIADGEGYSKIETIFYFDQKDRTPLLQQMTVGGRKMLMVRK